jgi:ubiquitin-protein ligase E3 A
MKLIALLSDEQRKEILDVIPHVYPAHLFASRLLKPLHEHLALQVQNPTGLAPLYCEGLRWLHTLNAEHKIVPATLFYNSALSDLSDSVLLKDYVEWKTYHITIAAQMKKPSSPPLPQQKPFFIATYSFLLSAEAKKRILLAESVIQQHAAQQQAAIAGLSQGFFIPFFILRIEREHLLQHTLQQIVSASDVDMRKPLRVIFENEEGIDEGGVRKEFFQLLVSQLLSVQYGMFTPTADGRALWINQSCLWNAEEFRLVGVLLGLAVYNGVLLDVHFPKVMYKKLLRVDRFELSDLASLDPSLHDGLKKLLEYTPEEEVESVFCRTFEVEVG